MFCPQRSDHRHDNGGDHHTGCHQSGGCRCGLSEVRRDLGYQQRSGHGSASSTRCGNSSRATALTQHDIHDYQWYACDNNDCQSHKNTQQSGVDDDAKINGIPQRKCKEWDQTFGGPENNSRSSGSRLPSKTPPERDQDAGEVFRFERCLPGGPQNNHRHQGPDSSEISTEAPASSLCRTPASGKHKARHWSYPSPQQSPEQINRQRNLFLPFPFR